MSTISTIVTMSTPTNSVSTIYSSLLFLHTLYTVYCEICVNTSEIIMQFVQYFFQIKKKKDLFKEPIGNDRFLTAGLYKDILNVHIRQYEMDDNSKLFPTRKGVAFNKSRWATFMRHLDDIDRSVDLLKANQPVSYYQHIGGRYYVTISKDIKCVNIRRYFLPHNSKKERPTRSGIALRLSEWESLVPKIRELQDQLPELKNAKSCYTSDDHMNQMGYLSCIECNPFGLGLTN